MSTADIDRAIAEAEERLKRMEMPARLLDHTDPADGYPDYLTEIEAAVRAPMVAACRWEIERLRELRAHLKGQDGNEPEH